MSGMYWLMLTLTTIGTAAVMFTMIACAMILAKWLEDRWTA